MKFWKIFLLVIFLPRAIFAEIGDDLQKLIDEFFPENSEFSTEKIENKKIEIPEIPHEIAEIRREIFDSEEKLAEIEQQILENQRKILEKKNLKNRAKNELFLLDSSLGIAEKKLENWQKNRKKFKKKLEKITKKKAEIETEIRFLQRDFLDFAIKNFVQKKNTEFGGKKNFLKWIFSEQKISEIFLAEQQKNFLQQRKKIKLKNLQKARKIAAAHEKLAAEIFWEIKNLTEKMAQQKKFWRDTAAAKAKIAEKNSLDEKKLAREIEIFRRQQNESTIFLQNLRIALKKADENFSADSAKIGAEIFDFPLKIPKKITVKFRDKNFKNEFGRDHNGVDFFAPHGTEIFAPADGRVEKIAENGFGYSYLILAHEKNFFTTFGHVSEILVRENQRVKKGEKIARTGGTPGTAGAGFFTTGPHLHFEIFRDGRFLNPENFFKN